MSMESSDEDYEWYDDGPMTERPSIELPHNERAEASLLGGLMFAPDNVADVMSAVDVDDFWKPAYGHVFQAIQDLFVAGDQPEAVPVAELLKSRGLLDSIGGVPGVVSLLNEAGAPSGLVKLAEIVHSHAMMRKLTSVGAEIREIGLSHPEDAHEALAKAEDMVLSVSGEKKQETIVPVQGLIDEALDKLDGLLRNDSDVTGLSTGCTGLDKMTSGFHKDQFIVIGARPSMGKSSFALGMALHSAFVERKPTLFFSLEMGSGELLQRAISNEGMVPLHALKNGNMMEDHWIKSHAVIQSLATAPLWIDDNANLTVADVRAKARKFKSRHGDLGMIVIDYLQLMMGRRGAENRQVEVSEISRGLKMLSKDLSCPVVALSQLSRGLENRSDKRPMLSDLRESGSVEQDADVVIFLYRDEIYIPDSGFKGTAEVIVAKQRSGPTGTVRMGFFGDYTRFVNLAEG